MKGLGSRRLGGLLLGACSCLLAACRTPARAPSRPLVVLRQSDKTARESMAVTVHNPNFGVVKGTRPKLGEADHDLLRRVALARGFEELSFINVSANIQPETFQLHWLTSGADLRYRYDLLTPSKLLEKCVGKRLTVDRYDEKTGTEENNVAGLLSVEGGATLTLRIDGEVTSPSRGASPWRFAFPCRARCFRDQTLVWLLDSDRGEQCIELT